MRITVDEMVRLNGNQLARLWPLLRDIGCFIVGVYLLNEQGTREHADPTVIAAGVALALGVPLSHAAISVITKRNDKNAR